MKINTAFLNASEFIFPDDRNEIDLILVGCGGNGSWLAPTIARVGRLLTETKQKKVQIYFIDPDHVEAKNVYRQNFSDAEIGLHKAVTLAHRFSTAFGVNITAIPEGFRSGLVTSGYTSSQHTSVLIGCVDGPEGRKQIAEQARANLMSRSGPATVWLDSGNRKTSGQVLLGGGSGGTKSFPIDGICGRLPLPSTQHPELVDDAYDSLPDLSGTEGPLSCADLALQGSQGLSVNQMVAAIAGHYLLTLLVTGGLKFYQTYFDLVAGSMSSTYILPKKVKADLKLENG